MHFFCHLKQVICQPNFFLLKSTYCGLSFFWKNIIMSVCGLCSLLFVIYMKTEQTMKLIFSRYVQFGLRFCSIIWEFWFWSRTPKSDLMHENSDRSLSEWYLGFKRSGSSQWVPKYLFICYCWYVLLQIHLFLEFWILLC